MNFGVFLLFLVDSLDKSFCHATRLHRDRRIFSSSSWQLGEVREFGCQPSLLTRWRVQESTTTVKMEIFARGMRVTATTYIRNYTLLSCTITSLVYRAPRGASYVRFVHCAKCSLLRYRPLSPPLSGMRSRRGSQYPISVK